MDPSSASGADSSNKSELKIQELVVGARGFEPRTSCAQGRRATRLRYAPTVTALFILKHFPTLLLIRVVIFGLTVPKLRPILYWIVALPASSDFSLARRFIFSKAFPINFILNECSS
jgi:hypothetical protein